ncbi:H-SHIPPO_1 [Hexamita inflata]|uniref:H-SHIPPO 1 n=1 Tax=Hexamita inflata TaxID=28002 RepID=A0AA86THM8_9EUKA|nr:H-SHIPPO 1 [Hexamita inflata]
MDLPLDVPGPGEYRPESCKPSKIRTPQSATISGRYDTYKPRPSPGPADYSNTISSLSSSGFTFPTFDEKSIKKRYQPGPGDYQPVFPQRNSQKSAFKFRTNLPKEPPGPPIGVYEPVTQRCSSAKFSFKQSDRFPNYVFQTKTPGPGAYIPNLDDLKPKRGLTIATKLKEAQKSVEKHESYSVHGNIQQGGFTMKFRIKRFYEEKKNK